jgi:hypothetical protein
MSRELMKMVGVSVCSSLCTALFVVACTEPNKATQDSSAPPTTLENDSAAPNDSSTPQDSGSPEPTDTGSSAGITFEFVPDEGVRLPCAAVPRVDWGADGQVYLYHSDQLTSGGGQAHAVSADGFEFGSSTESEQVVGEPITADDPPPMFHDRQGFPGVVALPAPSSRTWCDGGTHRIYKHNGSISGTFGAGLTSLCSTDGRWFWSEPDDRVTSPDGGDMGVVTGVVMNGRIHVFTMDGKSPNDAGENRHRIWHYAATDDAGDVLELISADPLNNGETDTPESRHNDPQALLLSDSSALLVTMQQHNGPIHPDSYRTGVIHGWRVSAEDPTQVAPLNLNEDGGNTPLIEPEQMGEAGHDVFSLNDPSVLDLGDSQFRLFMGAMVDISQYPDHPEFSDCVARETMDGAQLAWAIVSATSGN